MYHLFVHSTFYACNYTRNGQQSTSAACRWQPDASRHASRRRRSCIKIHAGRNQGAFWLVDLANYLLAKECCVEADSKQFPHSSHFSSLQSESIMAELRLRVCTWNCGNAQPSPNFAPWIPVGGGDSDLLVIAVQESSYKNKAAAAAEAVDDDEDEDTTVDGNGENVMDVSLQKQKSMRKRKSVNSEAAMRASNPDSQRVRSTTKAAKSVAASSCDVFDSVVAFLAAQLPSDPEVASMKTRFKYYSVQAEQGEKTATGLDRKLAEQRTEMLKNYNRRRSSASPPQLARLKGGVSAESAASAAGSSSSGADSALGNQWVVVDRLMLGANSGLVVEIGVMVLIRRRLLQHVNSVAHDTEATGILGVVANKGGVGISMSVFGTPLCFIGAHLAAHMHHLVARNSNVEEIMAGMHLGNPSISADVQHAHCFFTGDLNYRLDQDLIGDTPVADAGGNGAKKLKKEKRTAMHTMGQGLIDQRCWKQLMEGDQLHWSQRKGLSFSLFKEGEYNFPPTFKVERTPGFVYQPKRVQSYCDRVLWRSLPRLAKDVQCDGMEAHAAITSSDHKPVSGAFRLSIRSPLRLHPTAPHSAPILEFGDIAASHLMAADVSGASDPYIRFFSHPPGLFHPRNVSPQTPTRGLVDYSPSLAPESSMIRQTLNPKWNVEKHIPVLRLNVSDRGTLSKCHVLLTLMDFDALDSHDPIGSAVIDLTPLASSNTLQFVEPVTYNTRREGTLSGSIRIIWPGDEDYARASTPKKAGACGGCCTIA